MEPHIGAKYMHAKSYGSQWLQPTMVTQTNGHVEIAKTSHEPILLRRHEQIAMIRPIAAEDDVSLS